MSTVVGSSVPNDGWKSPSPLPRSFLPDLDAIATAIGGSPSSSRRPSVSEPQGSASGGSDGGEGVPLRKRAPTLAELSSVLRLHHPEKFTIPPPPPSADPKPTRPRLVARISSATLSRSLSARSGTPSTAESSPTSIAPATLPDEPQGVALPPPPPPPAQTQRPALLHSQSSPPAPTSSPPRGNGNAALPSLADVKARYAKSGSSASGGAGQRSAEAEMDEHSKRMLELLRGKRPSGAAGGGEGSTSPSEEKKEARMPMAGRPATARQMSTDEGVGVAHKPPSAPAPPPVLLPAPAPAPKPTPPSRPLALTHPLQHPWTFFFQSTPPPPPSSATTASAKHAHPRSPGAYAAGMLQEIGTSKDVESFCRYFNWIKRPSQVESGGSIMVFKDGIEPTWEHVANAKGGKWNLTVRDVELLDRSWTWLVMALVGEELDEDGLVCGAVLSILPAPRPPRIQLWTTTTHPVEPLNALAKRLVRLLEIGDKPGVQLEFKPHGSRKLEGAGTGFLVVNTTAAQTQATTVSREKGLGESGAWRRGVGAGVGIQEGTPRLSDRLRPRLPKHYTNIFRNTATALLVVYTAIAMFALYWVTKFFLLRHDAYAHSVFAPPMIPRPRPAAALVHPADHLPLNASGPLLQQELNARLTALGLAPPAIPCHLSSEDLARYAELPGGGPYFFALNLWNNERVFPTLARTILTLAEFLGPTNVAVSIFENGSTDNTTVAMGHLAAVLAAGGVQHSISYDERKTQWSKVDRIAQLSVYRNVALAPVNETISGRKFDDVVFVNDVFVCPRDALELLWQKRWQKADAVCAMDWRATKSWFEWAGFKVGRSITGEMFRARFDTMAEMRDGIKELFDQPGQEYSRERLRAAVPVPVYSCWNGMLAISAAPFRGDHGEAISFRSGFNKKGECAASECKTVARDFWAQGLRRWMMVPSVHVTYAEEVYTHPQLLSLNPVSRRTKDKDSPPELIDWDSLPAPENVTDEGTAV
ncbi:GDP-Man:alpha-1,3-mannosyltransferase, glycosyltransferase family 69 protein [Pseudohyphozyma bogoriensis]|nr:GDP-Man:alpha-1,3-mannosyltransferase, glycosyltransferase family 69 protein [Pseudohyphozyma bogoriensis]